MTLDAVDDLTLESFGLGLVGSGDDVEDLGLKIELTLLLMIVPGDNNAERRTLGLSSSSCKSGGV